MDIIGQHTFSLQRSRGCPSLWSRISRSWATLSRTSWVSLNGNTTSGSDNCCFGHQQLVHCVVGHIVAVDTSSPSILRKSRNTRDRRYWWSPKRKCMSRPVKSLICVARISMQEWYRRVLLSVRHSSGCKTVAAFEREGIIPSRSLQCRLDPGGDHPACPSAGGRHGPGSVHESLPNDKNISYNIYILDIYMSWIGYMNCIIMSYVYVWYMYFVTMSQTLSISFAPVTLLFILIYTFHMKGIY
jgi:hypothetical protein